MAPNSSSDNAPTSSSGAASVDLNAPALPTRRDALKRGAATLVGLGLAGVASSASGAESPAPAPAGCGKLKGKVAVVTGAARGIGRAIAVAFAKEGADILGIDIGGVPSSITKYPAATMDELEQTGKLVEAEGRKFVAVKADIRNLDALRTAGETVINKLGRLDIVVANAGIQAFASLLEMKDAQWHDIIEVNLTGAANTVRAFAPVLVNGKAGGRIILTSSTQGRHGSKNASAYSASKWGIYGLMKSAALELGEHKITVNALVPGLIDTPMTRNAMRWTEAIKDAGRQPSSENPKEEEVVQAQLPHIPLKVPWLKPEDVAPVAVFLASDDAQMVSGSSYDVTAGDTAHFI